MVRQLHHHDGSLECLGAGLAGGMLMRLLRAVEPASRTAPDMRTLVHAQLHWAEESYPASRECKSPCLMHWMRMSRRANSGRTSSFKAELPHKCAQENYQSFM
jgi:hypothetical protein